MFEFVYGGVWIELDAFRQILAEPKEPKPALYDGA
jgi:hypothetical protein